MEHIFSFGYFICFSRNLGPTQIFGGEKNEDLGKVSKIIMYVQYISTGPHLTYELTTYYRCVEQCLELTR